MEEWSRWEPVKNLSGRFIITSLTMVTEGLIIEVEAEDNDTTFKIKFKGSIDAYRCIHKSLFFYGFFDLSKKHGDEFYSKWSFFKIKNSEYINFLSTKSDRWAGELAFEYFCIVGNDEVVDVLAQYQSEIEVIA